MRTPRLSGRALTAARIAAEMPGTDATRRDPPRRSGGLHLLPTLPSMWRGELPFQAKPVVARAPRVWSDAGLAPPVVRDWPRCSGTYARAYRERGVTPRTVAERAIA